ncbi:MAG: chromosome partitioning protein ParB [Caldiserica bacterium]|nr:MAG: chromosome partitioning protein ParB [Caldisericota bacterium]
MKKVLGKGISALIPEEEMRKEEIVFIPVDRIKFSPHQVRKKFDEKLIKELSDSIKEKGIIQPVVVERKDDFFELIAGERRVRAAKLAGMKEIPAVVKQSLSEREKAEISLIENLQRENLNPYEVALGLKKLIDEFGLTQDEVARRVGKSRSSVANFLRILTYPEYIVEVLKSGEITEGHARALMMIKDERLRRYVLRRIIKEKLSVREVEEIGRSSVKEKGKRRKKEDIFLKDIEKKLQKKFGTKVEIKGNYKRGKIVFHYFSEEELNRILEFFK